MPIARVMSSSGKSWLGGEVAEGAHAPVDVLEAAVGRVGDGEAEEILEGGVSDFGEIGRAFMKGQDF